ncbi:MAG: hypothetical protein KC931_16990, partial [Candidatus Omnitrophica bacterium]|nr:hypothetical protein [Candidatus Omnitrophota bacterium]
MKSFSPLLFSILILSFCQITLSKDLLDIAWEGSGEEIYKTGFMKGMQKDGKGGSCLFKVDLVENDAPGAGMSEKGVCEDPI